VSTEKGKKKKGVLSQILRKFFTTRDSILEIMQQEGVDTREGDTDGAGVRISWKRGENTASFMKADKKGRFFVGQKFASQTTWGMNYKKSRYGKWSINTKITTTPAVIQVNVRPAQGKRGGWLINVHNQTPYFKENKFVFRCRWANYWASDAMIVAGLVTKFQGGKSGKSMFLSEVLDDHARAAMVIDNVQAFLFWNNMDRLPSHEERMEKKWAEAREREIFFRNWKKNILVTC